MDAARRWSIQACQIQLFAYVLFVIPIHKQIIQQYVHRSFLCLHLMRLMQYTFHSSMRMQTARGHCNVPCEFFNAPSNNFIYKKITNSHPFTQSAGNTCTTRYDWAEFNKNRPRLGVTGPLPLLIVGDCSGEGGGDRGRASMVTSAILFERLRGA